MLLLHRFDVNLVENQNAKVLVQRNRDLMHLQFVQVQGIASFLCSYEHHYITVLLITLLVLLVLVITPLRGMLMVYRHETLGPTAPGSRAYKPQHPE